MEGLSCDIQHIAAGDLDDAARALRADGAVLLEGVWAPETIDRVRASVFEGHPELSDPDRVSDKVKSGKGRFIAPIGIKPALVEHGLVGNETIERLSSRVLGNEFVFEAFGIMMAGAGATDQQTHRDTNPLFPETGIDPLLPPTALTIAIPLVDIGEQNGRTSLYLGSHRSGSIDGIEPASSSVRLGSALIWDFRTIHFGCANTTDEDRPLLYFTACRPFWFDHRNFGKDNRRLLADAELIPTLGDRFIRAEPIEGNNQ